MKKIVLFWMCFTASAFGNLVSWDEGSGVYVIDQFGAPVKIPGKALPGKKRFEIKKKLKRNENDKEDF